MSTPRNGKSGVCRGGSWDEPVATYLVLKLRFTVDPASKHSNIGFRVHRPMRLETSK